MNEKKYGLTTREAEINKKYGTNELSQRESESFLDMLKDSFKDTWVIILLVALGLKILFSIIGMFWPEIGGESEWIESIAIGISILAITFIGTFMNYRQDRGAQALQKEAAKIRCKVYRDGKLVELSINDIVIGDYVQLQPGDMVPADCVLRDGSIMVNQAAINGESSDAEKILLGDNPIPDSEDLFTELKAFRGTVVTSGSAVVEVTEVGDKTVVGSINVSLQEKNDEITPSEEKLNRLAKYIGVFGYIGGSVAAIINVVLGLMNAPAITFGFVANLVLSSIILGVSIIVMAVPEGLPLMNILVQALNVGKMLKAHIYVRNPKSIETAGYLKHLFTDKTGTLTQNKMTVVEDYTADRAILATAMTLCNDAEPDEDGNAVGEPTECALVNYATKHEFLKPALKASQPRIGEVPFDCSRKMMTTVHTVDGSVMQYTKGAPDELLARCTTILTENGVVALTDELRAEVMKHNKAMADKALRVLAAAYRKLDAEPAEYTVALETDLTFAGLCGMIDPVRPEVLEAIKDCRSAGIRPIMITGDHKDTAVAIALELGIITDASQAITGAELNEISDADFEKAIEKYSVYARVQPEHKVRIVAAWKKKGMITAMTGDGVNDAPSIKTADIGIGMGITGTDVTKNVADMVLADDNFATIVYAVEEGRKIYSNIRKAIQFLLSSNMSEVITIFTAQMIGFTILEAPHLLWINLITDCFPALALGVEPGESDIMKQPPRKSNEGIFAGGLGVDLVYQGFMVSALTLAAYIIGSLMDPAVTAWHFGIQSSHGITMAFLTMSMAEIFHSLNMRSQRGSIFTLKGRNLLLIGAMVLAFLLTTAVIEIPVLADLFGFTVIDLKEYLIALGLALTVIPVVEIVKLIQRAIKKN